MLVSSRVHALLRFVVISNTLLRLIWIVGVEDRTRLQFVGLSNLAVFAWYEVVAEDVFGLVTLVDMLLARVLPVGIGEHDLSVILLA